MTKREVVFHLKLGAKLVWVKITVTQPVVESLSILVRHIKEPNTKIIDRNQLDCEQRDENK